MKDIDYTLLCIENDKILDFHPPYQNDRLLRECLILLLSLPPYVKLSIGE